MAVKRIHKSRLKRTSNRKLLQSEIAILQELKHPHVVALYEHIQLDNYICLVMEYCNGGDLNEYIAKHAPMSERRIAELSRQIATALRYLHEKHIIHRDLKPQNILVHIKPGSRDPVFKIADFGFARHLNMDMAETFCGSPLYMAPEVLYGGSYDARSDLWSIGTILYQCVTKHPPYRAKSIEALKKVLAKPDAAKLAFPASASNPMKQLITGLLQIDPNRRISFADFFAHSFLGNNQATELALAGAGSSRPPMPGREQGPRPGVPYGDAPATPSPQNSVESLPSLVHVDPRGAPVTPGPEDEDTNHSYILVDKQHVELNALADDLENDRHGNRPPRQQSAPAPSWDAAVSKLTARAWAAQHPHAPSSRSTGRSPAGPGTSGPSPQEVETFVTSVERTTKPAGAVMLVARTHTNRNDPQVANAVRQIEGLKLFNKALTVLRHGMSGLRSSIDARSELLYTRRSNEAVQLLRSRFNECLTSIDELRRRIPNGMDLSHYRGMAVIPPEELLYQYAVGLCPEAATREAAGDLTTSEVLYSRVLIIFNLLLEEALPEDKPILQQYAASTRRRLETVVANQATRPLAETGPSVSSPQFRDGPQQGGRGGPRLDSPVHSSYHRGQQQQQPPQPQPPPRRPLGGMGRSIDGRQPLEGGSRGQHAYHADEMPQQHHPTQPRQASPPHQYRQQQEVHHSQPRDVPGGAGYGSSVDGVRGGRGSRVYGSPPVLPDDRAGAYSSPRSTPPELREEISRAYRGSPTSLPGDRATYGSPPVPVHGSPPALRGHLPAHPPAPHGSPPRRRRTESPSSLRNNAGVQRSIVEQQSQQSPLSAGDQSFRLSSPSDSAQRSQTRSPSYPSNNESLSPPWPARVVALAGRSPPPQKCEECGALLGASTKFCGECGAPQRGTQQQSHPEEHRPPVMMPEHDHNRAPPSGRDSFVATTPPEGSRSRVWVQPDNMVPPSGMRSQPDDGGAHWSQHQRAPGQHPSSSKHRENDLSREGSHEFDQHPHQRREQQHEPHRHQPELRTEPQPRDAAMRDRSSTWSQDDSVGRPRPRPTDMSASGRAPNVPIQAHFSASASPEYAPQATRSRAATMDSGDRPGMDLSRRSRRRSDPVQDATVTGSQPGMSASQRQSTAAEGSSLEEMDALRAQVAALQMKLQHSE